MIRFFFLAILILLFSPIILSFVITLSPFLLIGFLYKSTLDFLFDIKRENLVRQLKKKYKFVKRLERLQK